VTDKVKLDIVSDGMDKPADLQNSRESLHNNRLTILHCIYRKSKINDCVKLTPEYRLKAHLSSNSCHKGKTVSLL
jgi:hypothetical protein